MALRLLLLLGIASLLLNGCERNQEITAAKSSTNSNFREFRPLRADLASPSSTPSSAHDLASLGYLSGYRKAFQEGGVRVMDNAKMSPGLTIITSGHAPEAVLLDAKGVVIHSWRKEFSELFPQFQPSEDAPAPERTTYWRYAKVLPGGELLAIFEGLALIKLASDSSVLWARLNYAHHDLEVLPDGRIVGLTRQVVSGAQGPYLDEHLVILSPEGDEMDRLSLIGAIEQSSFRKEVFGNRPLRGDLLHSNSVQIVPSGLPHFPDGIQAGDYLISMRHTHTLAIVSHLSRKVVWTFKGDFRFQHFARLVPENGHLVVFDNLGRKTRSRVLEYEFPSMRLVRTYDGPNPALPFFTEFCGLAQPLGNGNLLIAESEAGRLLEITPSNQLVWEYLSPFRAGEQQELVAILAHADRVPQGILKIPPS